MDLKQQLRRLTGHTVMIDPQFGEDPENRRGQYGKIISVLQSRDSATVLFDDNKRCNFLYEDLLVLIPKKLLKTTYMHSVGKLQGRNSKVIVNTLLLLHHGRSREALQSAMQNDTVRTLCVVNCKKWVEITRQQNKRQKQRRP